MPSLEEKVSKANAEREALRDAAVESTPKGPSSKIAEAFGSIYFAGVAGDPERPKRWVTMASRVMEDKDDPHTGFQLQQCAQLDALLMAFESEKRTDPGPDPGPLYIAGQSFEFSIGDCWLLFIYEVLRTFRSSSSFTQFSGEQQAQFNDIFRLISLARIPVAKHQAAGTENKKKSSYVFHAPIHVLNDDLGTAGWRVFDKTAGEFIDILRRPLADALLLWAAGQLTEDDLRRISAPGARELIRIVKT